MRAIIGIALGAMLIAGQAQAQWRIAANTNGSVGAIGVDTIRVRGNQRTFWITRVYKNEVDAYTMVNSTIDCIAQTILTRDLVTYDLNGSVTLSQVSQAPAAAIVPGSSAAAVLDAVCNDRWPVGVFEVADGPELVQVVQSYWARNAR